METIQNRPQLLLLLLLSLVFQNGLQVCCLSIRPQACSAPSGDTGTCMFVWDCIKSDGKHIGTCTDRFLFGSCCAHNISTNDLKPDSDKENHSHLETQPSILSDNFDSAVSEISNELSPEDSDFKSSTTTISRFSSKPPIPPRPSYKPVIRPRPSYKPVFQFKPSFKPYVSASSKKPAFSQFSPFETSYQSDSSSNFIYPFGIQTNTKAPFRPQESDISTSNSTKDSYRPQRPSSGNNGYVTSIQINEHNKHWFRPTQSTSVYAITNQQGKFSTRTQPQTTKRPTRYPHPRPSWKPIFNNSTIHKPYSKPNEYTHFSSTTEKLEYARTSTKIPQVHSNHSLQNVADKSTAPPTPNFSFNPSHSTINPFSASANSPTSTVQLILAKPPNTPLNSTTIPILYPFSNRHTFKPFTTLTFFSLKNKQNITKTSPSVISTTNRPSSSSYFGGHTFKPFSYSTVDSVQTVVSSQFTQLFNKSAAYFQTNSSVTNTRLTPTKPSRPVTKTTTSTLTKPTHFFIKTTVSTSPKPRPSIETITTTTVKPSGPISKPTTSITKTPFTPNNRTTISSPTKPSRPNIKTTVSSLHNLEKPSRPTTKPILYTTSKPSRPITKTVKPTTGKPFRPITRTTRFTTQKPFLPVTKTTVFPTSKPSPPIANTTVFTTTQRLRPSMKPTVSTTTKPSRPTLKPTLSNTTKLPKPAIKPTLSTTTKPPRPHIKPTPYSTTKPSRPAIKPTPYSTTKPSRPATKPILSTAKPLRPTVKTSTKPPLFVTKPSVSLNPHKPVTKPTELVSAKPSRPATKTTIKPLSETFRPNLTTKTSIIISATSTTPKYTATTEQPATTSKTTKPVAVSVQVTSASVNEESVTTNFPVNINNQKPSNSWGPEITLDQENSMIDTHGGNYNFGATAYTEGIKFKSTTPLPIKPCGVPPPHPQKKVVGGQNSAFGSWPWQVSIRRTSFFGFSSTHRCGGALVSLQWVATAGHCVDDLLMAQIKIRIGEYDFSSSLEPHDYVEKGIIKKIVHPRYNFFTYENDLALVKLEDRIDTILHPHILPICLPPTDESLVGKNGTVTGWGRLSEGGALPSILQEVEVPIISNEQCKNMFLKAGRHEYIPDIFLCAGFAEGGRDSCQGDSGGPLQLQSEDGYWFLAGIISWGIGCAEPNMPGVCTRISKFKDWVVTSISELAPQ